jgi:hypothetical protein
MNLDLYYFLILSRNVTEGSGSFALRCEIN